MTPVSQYQVVNKKTSFQFAIPPAWGVGVVVGGGVFHDTDNDNGDTYMTLSG